MLTLGAYTTAALDCRQRRRAVASLSRAGRERRDRRGVRRDRRPAGAEAAHLLLRHDDARLRHHRHPGGAGLEERDRRRRRHAGPGIPLAVRSRLGLLLFLLPAGGARDLDDGQHRLEPLWPRPGRHPRRRSSRRGLGRRQTQAAGAGLPARRRAGRRGGRPVLLAAVLHHARCLHLRDVGAVLHRHPDRRARLDPRARARHHHPDGAARVRGAAGAMVDLPLRRAAAGDRAGDPRRHRRPARLQEPPAARAAPRNRAAARAAGAPARRATRHGRGAVARERRAALRRRARHRRPRPRDPARRGAWPDRPQRQRQDHDAERDLRLLRAAEGPGAAGRRAAAAGCAAPARATIASRAPSRRRA